MNHLGTKELETNRLILRRFQLSDAEAMFRNWTNDSEVTKYLRWPPHNDVSVSEYVLKEWILQYENPTFNQWAIVLKSNGNEPIGCISIVEMKEEINMVHVGYCIGKKWWNQGITSEALSALISFFFKEVKVNSIEVIPVPINPSPGKIIEKCGLIYEGTVKQGDRNNQGICDYSIFGLVAEDYKE